MQKSPRNVAAYVPDRKPTIYELARPQFMGLRDQRPAEMLKNELQYLPFTRKEFYHKPINLPLLNQSLCMKYKKMKNLSNVSPRAAKKMPFAPARANSSLNQHCVDKLINHNVRQEIFDKSQQFHSGGRVSPTR